MEIRGKIIEKYDTQQISEKFKKREFVIEYIEDKPQYPELIKFELGQDKCSLLDNFNVGQEVTVLFNLRGKKWTNPQGVANYFNSLSCWRIS